LCRNFFFIVGMIFDITAIIRKPTRKASKKNRHTRVVSFIVDNPVLMIERNRKPTEEADTTRMIATSSKIFSNLDMFSLL